MLQHCIDSSAKFGTIEQMQRHESLCPEGVCPGDVQTSASSSCTADEP